MPRVTADPEQQREQAVRQTKATVRQARRKLRAQHRRLAAKREHNRAQNGDHDSPTAPELKSTEQAATGNHSTVPSRPRKSTVPPEQRIYGLRFERSD